jgi:phosphatidylserine/phosphatidylglycerophosphate/cardiolipin synthase-like enzyme
MKNFGFIIGIIVVCLVMMFFETFAKSFADSCPLKKRPTYSYKQKTLQQSLFQDKPYVAPNEPNVPYFTDGTVSLYVTNPNLFLDAPDVLRTAIAKGLLQSINEAQKSIDFAVYGVEGQSAIVKALADDQKRGVLVRWVTDFDAKGNNIYPNTKQTMALLKNVTTDLPKNPLVPGNASALMHNKFFIIDNTTLISGSANLSDTDLSGFNANVYIKIKSPEVCCAFEREFEQMYGGFFHNAKSEIDNKTNIHLANNNVVSVYFSPKDKSISKAVVPLINQAHDYVYIPVFFFTDKKTSQALIAAKKRGVDVKVLLDAVAASNNYSCHKELRSAGIPVKVENWAGKMHQKSMIIDDNTVVIGSMNFSKSGEAKNDENCIVINNAPQLAQKYKQYFLMLYDSVPNKWLNKDPLPESIDSVGSCVDGVDNDFDGKIDAQDSSCFTFYKAKAAQKKKIYK